MKRRNYWCWRDEGYQLSPWCREWPGGFYRSNPSASETLAIRYVKGEISKEEYEKMKEELTKR